MHRQNSLGPRRDRLFQFGRIKGPALRVNIHKYRLGPGVADRPSGGDEGHWRGNDLVAWTDIEEPHSQVQRACAGINAHTMLDAAIIGERLLKFGCGWPLRKSS